MWSLLWTRLARKFGFWSKLLAVSSFLHIFLFFIFFFIYGQKSVFSIDINRSILNTGAPIIFMNIETGASIGVNGRGSNGGKNGQKASRNLAKNKSSQKPRDKYKSRIVNKKSLLANELREANKKALKKERLAREKKLRLEKVKERKLLQKQAREKRLLEKREREKKLRDKKLGVKKLLENKKKEAQEKKLREKKLLEQRQQKEKELLKKKEQEAKKKQEAEKLEEKKLQDNISLPEQEEQENLESNAQGDNSQNSALPESLTINVQDGELSSCDGQNQQAVYIGQQEIEILKMQYEVEKEVAKYWRPPEGLAKDLSCAVNVLVDWNGKVTQVKVDKSSGVLMYDISARVAASKLTLPSSLYGKDINIVFNQ